MSDDIVPLTSFSLTHVHYVRIYSLKDPPTFSLDTRKGPLA